MIEQEEIRNKQTNPFLEGISRILKEILPKQSVYINKKYRHISTSFGGMVSKYENRWWLHMCLVFCSSGVI